MIADLAHALPARGPRMSIANDRLFRLPDVVHQHCWRFDRDHCKEREHLLPHIVLPPNLRSAATKRQSQFLAGRYCAFCALESLACGLGQADVGQLADGAPVWPRGIVGSITHTSSFAAAAVAFATDATDIGIDTEDVVSSEQAEAIAGVVASPTEIELARAAGLSRVEAITMLFSAKESAFKCLNRRVGRLFGFDELRVTEVDGRIHTFTARFGSGISASTAADLNIEGRFRFEDGRVHTCMLVAS